MGAWIEPGIKRATLARVRQVLVETDRPMQTSVVAREAGMDQSTASRYLRRMAAHGEATTHDIVSPSWTSVMYAAV